jgi:hypothetical protein
MLDRTQHVLIAIALGVGVIVGLLASVTVTSLAAVQTAVGSSEPATALKLGVAAASLVTIASVAAISGAVSEVRARRRAQRLQAELDRIYDEHRGLFEGVHEAVADTLAEPRR